MSVLPKATRQHVCHNSRWNQVKGRIICTGKCGTFFHQFVRIEWVWWNHLSFYNTPWKPDTTREGIGCPSEAREVSVPGTHHVNKPCWSGTYQGQLGRNPQSWEPLSAGLLTLQWQFPTQNQKQGKMDKNFTPRWDVAAIPHVLRNHFFPIRAVRAV